MERTTLVTDGNQRAALAIARSLGRAGHRCVVVSADGCSLTGASKYVVKEVAVPDASVQPEEYVSALTRLVQAENIDLVIPVTEPTLLAVLPRRDAIPARIPFPEIETFRAVCDKGGVIEAARKVGLRTPEQIVLDPGDTVSAVEARLPVILKPVRSVYTSREGTRAKVGVRWARTAAELSTALGSYPEAAYPILAQEVITGPGIGVFVLMKEGRLLASFSHRRIREKPPAGGVSVLRQSEPMNPDLLARSLALLERLGWSSGVAMVEYKRDVITRDAVLMEINGRFWGSLQLAVDAGVDFPRLLADISFGREVQTVQGYRFARSRWFWGDVDHLIALMRDSRVNWVQRFQAFGGILRAFGPGYRSEVFRWTDVRPFLRETRSWFTTALTR